MKDLIKEDIRFFQKLKTEISKQEKAYFYNIVHQMNIEPSNFWVSSNLTPKAMTGLIAYIEHISFDITNEFSVALEESEIMELINKFYFDVQYLAAQPKTDYYEIDLYLNWEEHASYSFEEGMPELHREGFLDYVKEMAVRNKWGQDLEIS